MTRRVCRNLAGAKKRPEKLLLIIVFSSSHSFLGPVSSPRVERGGSEQKVTRHESMAINSVCRTKRRQKGGKPASTVRAYSRTTPPGRELLNHATAALVVCLTKTLRVILRFRCCIERRVESESNGKKTQFSLLSIMFNWKTTASRSSADRPSVTLQSRSSLVARQLPLPCRTTVFCPL
jgi:hypothetical protein